MEEIIVTSWNDLNERLYQDSWMPDIRRHRSHFAFRGLSTASYPLETTLARLRGDPGRLEGHLLRNFRKYAHQNVIERDSLWNWLALAQHHHLPTRLLDWTYSPYVALHFATAETEKSNLDGVVWCVDFVAVRKLLPKILAGELDREGADVFTVEMLTRVAGSLATFDSLSDESFAAFIEPPSLDDRIVNQFALFSVLSNSRASFEDWLVLHPDLVRKVIIPSGLKWEVRDKLDQANISERVLFPGLDGLSQWLKRHYSYRD
ncbi:MAG: FRG domain-containing protein [Acidobacteria bacterium]|nr:MAG: FRG domain-containing protein [Acidobacteriota bacterium]TDI46935.1 MAG: FRG domain-containing protein [Acidobacteriota bacterium]